MMVYMLNHPRLLSVACLIAMWLFARLGAWLRLRLQIPLSAEKTNLGFVVSATLTLLGLIIGFTFSMGTTRYDQRKLYEEEEANAIGTEFVRVGLLPSGDAAQLRHLLQMYLQARIDFYQSGYQANLHRIDTRTSDLQIQLWQGILPSAAATPTPVTALVVSGMNDVLNSQSYSQFSWWNRIPLSAWGLLMAIAVFANLLIGYSTERSKSGNLLLLVIPLIVAVSFFMVSDLDSPRGGIIQIQPLDLLSLSETLHKG